MGKVKGAENEAENALKIATALKDDSNTLEATQCFKIASSSEDQGNAAIAACSASADFLAENKATILEAKSLVDESLAAIKDVQGRIKAALTKAAETVRSAKKSKEEVANKFAAERRAKRWASCLRSTIKIAM